MEFSWRQAGIQRTEVVFADVDCFTAGVGRHIDRQGDVEKKEAYYVEEDDFTGPGGSVGQ